MQSQALDGAVSGGAGRSAWIAHYTEYDDFHYKWHGRHQSSPAARRPTDISPENCRLESPGEALLLKCALGTVTIHSDQRPARRWKSGTARRRGSLRKTFGSRQGLR
jgi:hypothetical protein